MKDTNSRDKNLSWLENQPLEYQISLFQEYSEIMKIVANSLLNQSINKKCGERYSREKPEEGRYSRWGFNPGSIKVGDEKIKIEVPRYYDEVTESTKNADVYGELKEQENPNEKMIKSILLGLSQKDYGQISSTLAESFGLSQSSISRNYISERLKSIRNI